MFDTIMRNKSHYQKRAYQCIKCLVTLFSSCTVAHHLLKSTPDFKSKWEAAIAWLQEELDRRPFGSTGNQYSYNWSPPAPSNDSSNGYYLERSQSARITLSKAVLLIPEEEKAGEDREEAAPEEADSPAGSSSLSSSQSQVTVFEDKDHTDQRQMEIPFSNDSGEQGHPGRYDTIGPPSDQKRRPSRRRRMALAEWRSDAGVGKPDVCDPLKLTSDGTGKLCQTGPIRAPSPIPPATDWSQHQPSSSTGVKWQSDVKQKMSSTAWWEKSLDATSGSREYVEEVEEVSDK